MRHHEILKRPGKINQFTPGKDTFEYYLQCVKDNVKAFKSNNDFLIISAGFLIQRQTTL